MRDLIEKEKNVSSDYLKKSLPNEKISRRQKNINGDQSF